MSEVHPQDKTAPTTTKPGAGASPGSSAGGLTRAGVAKARAAGLDHDGQVAGMAVPDGAGWPSPGTAMVGGYEWTDPDIFRGAERRTGIALLDRTTEAIRQYAKAIADWQSDGWGAFLDKVGGDGFIALPSAEQRELIGGPITPPTDLAPPPAPTTPASVLADAEMNAGLAAGVSAVGAPLAKSGLKAATSGAGEALAGTALLAFTGAGIPGFVLGVLVNVIWSIIAGSNESRAAYEAGRKAARSTRAISNAIRKGADGVNDDWASKRAGIASIIDDDTAGSAELRALNGWLTANLAALAPPALSPEPLTQRLYELWLRQRAGDEEDANADTNANAYGEVKKELGREGRGFENTPDLFVDQAKYAWGKLGLSLDGPIATLNGALSAVRPKGAPAIAGALSGMWVTLDEVKSPEAFVAALPAPTRMPPAFGGREDVKAAAENQTFALRCRVALDETDGTVYVERFDYALTPKPGFDADRVTQSKDGQLPGLIVPRSWTEKPT